MECSVWCVPDNVSSREYIGRRAASVYEFFEDDMPELYDFLLDTTGYQACLYLLEASKLWFFSFAYMTDQAVVVAGCGTTMQAAVDAAMQQPGVLTALAEANPKQSVDTRTMTARAVIQPHAEKTTVVGVVNTKDHQWIMNNNAAVSIVLDDVGTIVNVSLDCGFRINDEEDGDPDELLWLLAANPNEVGKLRTVVAALVETAKREIEDGRKLFPRKQEKYDA